MPRVSHLLEGILIFSLGLSAGTVGLPLILLGIGLVTAYAARSIHIFKGENGEAQGKPKGETEDRITIRKKERASYTGSATYREHYDHKEAPQPPIDWERYRENLGPAPKKLRRQTRELYEAGLLTREEYRQRLAQIQEK